MTTSQKNWKERFDIQVPWYDGIQGTYVYVKNVEPFIDAELAAAKEEGRREVHELYVAILEEMRGEFREMTEMVREARALRDNETTS